MNSSDTIYYSDFMFLSSDNLSHESSRSLSDINKQSEKLCSEIKERIKFNFYKDLLPLSPDNIIVSGMVLDYRQKAEKSSSYSQFRSKWGNSSTHR